MKFVFKNFYITAIAALSILSIVESDCCWTLRKPIHHFQIICSMVPPYLALTDQYSFLHLIAKISEHLIIKIY